MRLPNFNRIVIAAALAALATTVALATPNAFGQGSGAKQPPPAHAAAHPRSARATASDTVTWVWQSPELQFFHSIYLPKMVCPADHPYMLHQYYNDGSGFRLEPGVEIADYQRGLDVVALSALVMPHQQGGEQGQILVGISGAQDVVMNTATNWGSASRFKVVLHCTSDPARGTFIAPHHDS